jgi:hypothetical protein
MQDDVLLYSGVILELGTSLSFQVRIDKPHATACGQADAPWATESNTGNWMRSREDDTAALVTAGGGVLFTPFAVFGQQSGQPFR